MITFRPLLLTWSQFVVITLRGKGSGTRESCTSATTVRWRQRAVPSERTQTLPSAFASYAGWLGTTAGAEYFVAPPPLSRTMGRQPFVTPPVQAGVVAYSAPVKLWLSDVASGH